MSKVKYILNHPFLAASCLLSIICFLLICSPQGLYFLCDDWAHIPASINGNFFQTILLRPVVYITLWLDIKMWYMNPSGFHLTNLVLHLISSLLVYFLSKEILSRYCLTTLKHTFISFFAALFFLCYAFHSESIFWIVGRDSVLATIFIQLSILFILREKILYLFLSSLSFGVALFTYELSWVEPLILSAFCIYEFLIGKRKSLVIPVVFLWILFILFIWFRFSFLDYNLSYGTQSLFGENYLTLLRNLLTLLARLYVPPSQSGSVFLFSFLIITVIFSLLLFRTYDKSRHVFYIVLLLGISSVIAILPVIALGIDTHDTESERFIYLSSAFTSILFVYILGILLPNKNILCYFFFIIIVLNLYLLNRSSESYRYASYVSKTIIDGLNNFSTVKRITFYNLPSQYRGALLFRIGFPKYAPGLLSTMYDSIQIVSFKELQNVKEWTIENKIPQKSIKHLIVEFDEDKIIFR